MQVMERPQTKMASQEFLPASVDWEKGIRPGVGTIIGKSIAQSAMVRIWSVERGD
jgi:hypothetical protein